MKTSFIKSLAVGLVLAASMSLTVLPAGAANRYSSGDKTWNTSASNWGTVSGGSYTTAIWNNATPDSAIFEGTAGTVTLGQAISIQNLTFNNTAGTYILTGSTLSFSAGGTITAPNPPDTFTVCAIIQSNITGSPALVLTTMGGDEQFTLNPGSGGSMSIGTVSGSGGLGSQKLNLQGGAGSSGTIADFNGVKWIQTAGVWTANGDGSFGYGHAISGGTLTLNANLNATHRSVTLGGTGVINYNVANAVSATAATSGSGTDNGFRLQTGATLDQTSGAAINTSTTNPSMTWEGNWTFIGSNGTNSDLNLGTGIVYLKAANPQVTVSNAATTLIVGGVIANDDTAGRGLTKAGDGALELRGVSTYTGASTVSNGTLLIKSPGSLDASSAVAVNGGTLGGNGTVGGTVTVGASGSIAPSSPGSSSVGTLSIGGGLNISAMANGGTGKLKFDLNAPPPAVNNDKITVTGTLTIGSGLLGLSDFVFTKGVGFKEGIYTLITSGGINPGDTLNDADCKDLIDGLIHTIRINGNNIELAVRPESGTVIIIR